MLAPAILLIAIVSAVFAKGGGKPGTYTTRDGRTFAAGSAVPRNLNKDDLAHWKAEGYIVEASQADVDEIGGVAHDVPDSDLTPTQRARRSRKAAGEATVPKSSLREDPTAPDPDGDLDDAAATDPEGVADGAEESGREDTASSEAAEDAGDGDSMDDGGEAASTTASRARSAPSRAPAPARKASGKRSR